MRRLLSTVLILLVILSAASCSKKSVSNRSTMKQALPSRYVSSSVMDESSSETETTCTLKSTASSDSLQDQASKYGSSPGRIALAMIINKLDSTQAVEDLAKKNAQELFSIIQNTTPQKSQTLEGLDQLYELHAILASEGIYVQIQANDVISAPACSQSKDWISKFEAAIKSGG